MEEFPIDLTYTFWVELKRTPETHVFFSLLNERTEGEMNHIMGSSTNVYTLNEIIKKDSTDIDTDFYFDIDVLKYRNHVCDKLIRPCELGCQVLNKYEGLFKAVDSLEITIDPGDLGKEKQYKFFRDCKGRWYEEIIF